MQIVQAGNGVRRLDTGSQWEKRMGYSRAVEAGGMIWIAGCIGIETDGSMSDSLSRQSTRCLERIEEALSAMDASLESLVKIRIYTTCIDRWPEIAEAIEPRLRDCRPANVLLGVDALADGAHVEIEAEAFKA